MFQEQEKLLMEWLLDHIVLIVAHSNVHQSYLMSTGLTFLNKYWSLTSLQEQVFLYRVMSTASFIVNSSKIIDRYLRFWTNIFITSARTN